MLDVALVFIFFAAVAFLGFIINALFYKLKISNILPLMLIGVLVGPVFHIINTGPGSLASFLAPYISAIAIAFILFDVGLNMEAGRLASVFARATTFTMALGAATGIAIAALAYYLLGWNLLVALIFGFAVAGPSSISVPALMKVIKARVDLKTVLRYESVTSDLLQLIVPLVLIGLILSPITTLSEVAYFTFTVVIGSILLALVSALFWLYIMNRYREQSKSYSWMLTVTMIVATYGVAEALNLAGAIAVFVFGIAFATIGGIENAKKGSLLSANIFRKFSLPSGIKHIRSYQREIVFVTNTFFFVYVGMLLNLGGITLYLLAAASAITILIVLLRFAFSPMIGKYYDEDNKTMNAERLLVYFDIARGISPIIIAVALITNNIIVPGLLTLIFLVVLLTNIVSTAGIWIAYKDIEWIGSANGEAAKKGQEKLGSKK